MRHEIWAELVEMCADAYIDIEKLYDSICLWALAIEANDRGYPAVPLALAFSMFFGTESFVPEWGSRYFNCVQHLHCARGYAEQPYGQSHSLEMHAFY